LRWGGMVNSGSKPVARKFVSQSEVSESADFGQKLAPQVGLEPTTLRLTAGCSAIELLRSVMEQELSYP
jgi:hypothetical protein